MGTASLMTMSSLITIIMMLGSIVIPVAIVVFIYKAYKKNVKRQEEHLSIEKQQTFNLQKQVNELNERVMKLETLLKEVD